MQLQLFAEKSALKNESKPSNAWSSETQIDHPFLAPNNFDLNSKFRRTHIRTLRFLSLFFESASRTGKSAGVNKSFPPKFTCVNAPSIHIRFRSIRCCQNTSPSITQTHRTQSHHGIGQTWLYLFFFRGGSRIFVDKCQRKRANGRRYKCQRKRATGRRYKEKEQVILSLKEDVC